MVADGFRKQPLCGWQSKDLFGKSVKRSFTQLFRLRSDALNGCTTSDKPVRPLAPISFFIVGGSVFKALDFVLLLRKLTLDLFLFVLQLFYLFFVHDFNLLTDIKIGTKRPPPFSVDGLRDDMEFSGFAMEIDCASRLFPLQSALG